MADTWVVGDVHGCAVPLRRLLRRLGLVDDSGTWSGADARVIFVGDFVDRGPNGLEVLDDVIRLEREAGEAGGSVGGVLGNHDAMLLAVRELGAEVMPGFDQTFLELWVMNGGDPAEMRGISGAQVAFLRSLPALQLARETLIAHADSSFYLEYGRSLEIVNERIATIVNGRDPHSWTQLLIQFNRRRELTDPDVVDRMLAAFGGRRIVHGHTPIPLELDLEAAEVTEPKVNLDGRVINVDGGLFLGSPGVAVRL